MIPLYALHKNRDGKVLSAGSFEYSFDCDKWLRSLDLRAGDTITFDEVAQRECEPEVAPAMQDVAA